MTLDVLESRVLLKIKSTLSDISKCSGTVRFCRFLPKTNVNQTSDGEIRTDETEDSQETVTYLEKNNSRHMETTMSKDD